MSGSVSSVPPAATPCFEGGSRGHRLGALSLTAALVLATGPVGVALAALVVAVWRVAGPLYAVGAGLVGLLVAGAAPPPADLLATVAPTGATALRAATAVAFGPVGGDPLANGALVGLPPGERVPGRAWAGVLLATAGLLSVPLAAYGRVAPGDAVVGAGAGVAVVTLGAVAGGLMLAPPVGTAAGGLAALAAGAYAVYRYELVELGRVSGAVAARGGRREGDDG